MPELLGFEEHNGEVVAAVNFKNARKFIPQLGGNGKIGMQAVPNPHQALMNADDIQKHIKSIEDNNKDSTFFRTTLKKLEARSEAMEVTKAVERIQPQAPNQKPPTL